MEYMLNGCINFKGNGLEKWAGKVTKVEDFSGMLGNEKLNEEIVEVIETFNSLNKS